MATERSKKMIILTVSLALFMDALDTTIINTAIPAISHSLAVNPIDLKIALLSYLLSLAVFIPVSGWIADKFGIKRVFISALAVFTASSLWCGHATSLLELVIARAFQGLGGSLMLPLGRLMIVRTFDRHELITVMNHVVMVVSVGLMLGPLAGGFITDHFSWPWIFWVNIPIGLFAIIMATTCFKEHTIPEIRPLDTLGFILFGGGLAMLVFSLSDLSESNVQQTVAFISLCASIMMLVTYFLYSRKQPYPIIHTELFKIRTFRISIIGNLFSRLGFGGVPFLLPLLMQISLGYSAQLSGALLVPIAFGILFVKSITLHLLRFTGFKSLLLINTFLVGFVLITFKMIDIDTSIATIGCITFIFGILISLQYSGMNALAYADVHADDLSAATSITSTMQQIAQSLGVAVSALLLRYYAPHHETNLLTPAIFHQTFLTLGFFTFLSSILFIRLHKNDGQHMLNAPKKAEILQ